MFTHLQSRFLLPLAVTGCGAVALGLAAVLPTARGARASAGDGRSPWHGSMAHGFVFGAGSLIVVTHVGMAIGIFSGQSDGKPNQWITSSPWLRSGELDRRVLAAEPGRAKELAASAWPEVFVNVLLPPGRTVYLLGDGAPLYFTCPVLYNTTWDKWPLGEAMRRTPGKPSVWTKELWNRQVQFVLVNAAEIDRLQKSGWADPMVTNDAVNAWLKEEGRLIRSWPEIGVGLFELRGDR